MSTHNTQKLRHGQIEVGTQRLLSFMNCLNESVGSKDMECWFLYFILLLPIMHNTSDDLDIQPVCSNGVVRINGLWWMPLLVDYVGSLVLFPIRV